MYKFVLLSVVIAIVAAKPGYHYEKPEFHDETPGYHYEKPLVHISHPVEEHHLVEHVEREPTVVSHHSTNIVHNTVPLVHVTHHYPIEEHHVVEHRVEREPTVVSHHSTNIIHSTARVSTPVITTYVKKEAVPIYETYIPPVVHTEHVHIPEEYSIVKPTYETHDIGYDYPVPEKHFSNPEVEYLPPATIPETSEAIEVTNTEFSGDEYVPPTMTETEDLTSEDSGYHYTPPAKLF